MSWDNFRLLQQQGRTHRLQAVVVQFLTKKIIGTDVAATIMVVLMLPFFFFALYQKDGLPLEKIILNYIRTKKNPKVRPYKTENMYQYLVDEGKRQGVRRIEAKKRNKTTHRK